MKSRHRKLEEMAWEYLVSIGYDAKTEHRIQIGDKALIIDVYGERRKEGVNGKGKNIETIAIECGNIDAKKLAVISLQFDKVIIWGHNVEFLGNVFTKRLYEQSVKLTICMEKIKALETIISNTNSKTVINCKTIEEARAVFCNVLLMYPIGMSWEKVKNRINWETYRPYSQHEILKTLYNQKKILFVIGKSGVKGGRKPTLLFAKEHEKEAKKHKNILSWEMFVCRVHI